MIGAKRLTLPPDSGRGLKRKCPAKEEASTLKPQENDIVKKPRLSRREPDLKEPAYFPERKNLENDVLKKPRLSRPEPELKEESAYFPERRNLEDLWQDVFPFGTKWEHMDRLHEFKWNFSNLKEAFEKFGELYGEKVYLFVYPEHQLLKVGDKRKIILIPVVVAVVSPIPPFDKIGVRSPQMDRAEIIPMEAMKMAWMPYIPLQNRQNNINGLETQIHILVCTLQRSALEHMEIERLKLYGYCFPYIQPLQPNIEKHDRIVDILYRLDPHPLISYPFDWKVDDVEEVANDFIKRKALPEGKKEHFKAYVDVQVAERKQARREAKEARRRAIEDMDPQLRAALENKRFYKFYPVQTPDIPNLSNAKHISINKYYGNALAVL